MGRVINTDSTGKNRNQQMRLAAEILRRLMQKTELDDEALDMVATLYFAFRKIEDGIESSAGVWEDRDYYLKAEELRRRWDWVSRAKDNIKSLALEERWVDLPATLVKLLPYFADITVVKFTSKPSDWQGMYAKLLEEQRKTR
ncbi:MAG: hypothetical protein KME04_03520 [Pleurocapsa minor GSE-CHR-MK-17-07R]|jgi:hypothetical protein|nr:hypothetical protein [Pleurocapsa minor GSE-CHR-MK 17-07R]